MLHELNPFSSINLSLAWNKSIFAQFIHFRPTQYDHSWSTYPKTNYVVRATWSWDNISAHKSSINPLVLIWPFLHVWENKCPSWWLHETLPVGTSFKWTLIMICQKKKKLLKLNGPLLWFVTIFFLTSAEKIIVIWDSLVVVLLPHFEGTTDKSWKLWNFQQSQKTFDWLF
jgi:hypothetical protein